MYNIRSNYLKMKKAQQILFIIFNINTNDNNY